MKWRMSHELLSCGRNGQGKIGSSRLRMADNGCDQTGVRFRQYERPPSYVRNGSKAGISAHRLNLNQ